MSRGAMLVTGASGGIGTATVRHLAKDGWIVFCGYPRARSRRRAGSATRGRGDPCAPRCDVRRVDPGRADPGRRAPGTQSPISYQERGSRQAILFLHEWSTNADTYRRTVEFFADRYRLIFPDWPYAIHEVAMNPDADLSTPGLARIVDEFMAGLDDEPQHVPNAVK